MGCKSWTQAVLTPPSIFCGATVPAAAASACCVGFVWVGSFLASALEGVPLGRLPAIAS